MEAIFWDEKSIAGVELRLEDRKKGRVSDKDELQHALQENADWDAIFFAPHRLAYSPITVDRIEEGQHPVESRATLCFAQKPLTGGVSANDVE